MSETTEQKLDALMKSVSAIAENQKAFDVKFRKFEEDVATAQEDATERAKRERPLEFRKKGHEEQFVFNAEVGDRIESAAKRVKKMSAPTERDAKVAQEALYELRSVPKMKHLKKFVIPKIAARWKDVADFLDFDISTIEEIEENFGRECGKCCDTLLRSWISTSHGVGPKTWGTLLRALKEIDDLTAVTEDIEKKLELK